MKQGKHGAKAIERAIDITLQSRLAALMPYFTLGYPDLKESLRIVAAIAPYSDLLELGVPFSDPIADGPTIQRSTQRALENGVTTTSCLESVLDLRRMGIDKPILLMGYYNPIIAYGERTFVKDAADAGVDGFIVPDLPPEEAHELRSEAARQGLALIHFLAPTSNQRRVQLVVAKASGFVYVVSVTGVTGARKDFDYDLAQLVMQIRSLSRTPIAVGFGISTPAQASAVGEFADGVIVGSALIDAVDASTDKPAAAAAFVQAFASGLARS